MSIPEVVSAVRDAASRDRFMRRPEVRAITGVSDSQLYVLIGKGQFPRPVQLSPRCVGWSEIAVQQWVEARKREAEAAGGQLFAGGVK